MPDFIDRFGVDGVLDSSRQSIITSLLSAGCVYLLLLFVLLFFNPANLAILSEPSCKTPTNGRLQRETDRVTDIFASLFSSGSLAQAFTSDSLGRRPSILIWSGIFTIGVLIQTATDRSIVQITIGRFIAGLGVGALSGTPIFFYPNDPGEGLTNSISLPYSYRPALYR